MAEIQALILSKVVPGGIVSLVIGIIFFLGRSKFLTMFTSTKIEKLVYSKEKKFFIKSIKRGFIVFVIALILFYFSVLLMFLTIKFVLMIITIFVIGYLIIGAIFYAIVSCKKGLKEYFDEADRKIAVLLILLYNLLIFSLVPLIFGSLISLNPENIKQIADPKKIMEFKFLIVFTIIVFISIGIIYLYMFKNTLVIIEKGIGVDKPLFIKFENDIKVAKWYIFHPNENNQFLLGDNPIQDKCTVYKFIEKEELLKKELHVHEEENPPEA